MGEIIDGLWESTHQTYHHKLHDDLVICMQEFQEIAGKSPRIPRNLDGDIDWDLISVGLLYQFFNLEARKVNHNHENIEDNTIRSGRDISDERPSESSKPKITKTKSNNRKSDDDRKRS